MTKEKKSVSAAELLARLERDPKHEARAREREQVRLAKIAVNEKAAAPIVQELVAAGFDVNTVADLHNKRLDYPEAIPILLSWLTKVQNVDVKQDIVRRPVHITGPSGGGGQRSSTRRETGAV
jgi:hypothetical protein